MLPVTIRELRCSNCGSLNRVGTYGIDKLPRCGKCQSGLPEPLGKRILRRLYVFRRLFMIAAGVGAVAIFKPSILTDFLPDSSTAKPPTAAAAAACVGVSQPWTGLYASYNPLERVSRLTIKTSPGGYYFVKLEDSVTARPVMTFFLRGGEIFRQDVPEGSFVLKYATGDVWCGEGALFGPTTSTHKADEVFEFSGTGGYTVELIARKSGNLRTRAIDRNQF
ncbi:MAG: hypothetical protein OJF48_001742 [Afipia sp.]|nr:MAG: hypothetical protein OJF48_001742 [Afipia sp.]